MLTQGMAIEGATHGMAIEGATVEGVTEAVAASYGFCQQSC
jgi:hypothetical protein